ncbi:MAG: transcription termination factor NusA [Blastocatellia bacterium]|nr:transcription termination factor NusA [Blastocatellia bacterium]
MSTSPIPQTIDILSREKNIDPQIIISAIEDAVVTAARKQFKTTEDLRARYNPENGDVELFALMTVVSEVTDPATEISLADVEAMGVEGAEVGDQLEFPKAREELGRIAAQTAKQIIFQKVREAERNNVYDEYIGRMGELVHGFVKRFEGGRIIVDLGKIEAVMPKPQQSRAEGFSQGERIRVVIHSVSKEAKGPQVEVSRTSPELLKRLFEMEVPEIYDGTVQIKAAVREPGDRAKIAVISTERDVDPVGACVGMKGSRVQAIIRELRGERIDIIEWSEDHAVFAANALSPAKVSKVEINSFEDKKLTVTVPEDQLSLAIGKKGQNVRLAAKLINWHIDIRSAEEAARAAAAQLEAVMAGGEATLADIRESLALDQITAERLKDRGIETIDQLSPLSLDELVDAIDVSFDQATDILDRAQRLLAQKHAREAQAAREEATSEEAATAEAAQETEAATIEEAPSAEYADAEAAEEAEVATKKEIFVEEAPSVEGVEISTPTVREGFEGAVPAEEAGADQEMSLVEHKDSFLTSQVATAEEAPPVEDREAVTEKIATAAQDAENYITTPLEVPEEIAQDETVSHTALAQADETAAETGAEESDSSAEEPVRQADDGAVEEAVEEEPETAASESEPLAADIEDSAAATEKEDFLISVALSDEVDTQPLDRESSDEIAASDEEGRFPYIYGEVSGQDTEVSSETTEDETERKEND